MKIEELNQNQVVSHLAIARTEKSEPADAQGETSAKSNTAADKVELSSYMPVVPSKARQDAKVNRVAELQSQIKSGTYQVSGRAVAEKMLSKIVMSTSN
jgi:negative regulator of flagellin synthesis FlgM